MLKLVKSTSSENYPINPQTSAVRKLSVKANVGGVADLQSSYLIIKNGMQTTVNSLPAVRNVGWGCYFDENNIVEYPASAQVVYAELLIGGQSIQYLEDVNVRTVNLVTYKKNDEQLKKESNMGTYGFQRLESGAKSASPAVVANNIRNQGAYMSPFLSQSLDDATSKIMSSASYKEVASVIKLSDLFSFCEAMGTDQLNLNGRDIEIKLQFEDRKQILAEFVNYKASYDYTNAQLTPMTQNTLALDKYVTLGNGNPLNGTAFTALTLDEVVDAGIIFRTSNTYKNVVDIPLYVGMPFAVWRGDNLPTTKGSNCFTIVSLSLDGNGKCLILCQPYFAGADVDGSRIYIQPAVAGTAVTPTQILQSFADNADPVTAQAIALSGIVDPIVKAGTVTDFTTNNDNGLQSLYSVNGLELVVVEKMVQGKKQSIEFVNYLRDSDVIPANATNYNKSFMLDPQVGAVFAFIPPALPTRANDGDVNLLSCTRTRTIANPPVNISNGLTVRSMLNGQPCYTRDIVFSTNNFTVEPLYFHRLYLSAQKIGMKLNNMSTVEHFMAKDGVNQHCMIVEPVDMSSAPQQFLVRLSFTDNTTARTIYLYKAQMQMVEI